MKEMKLMPLFIQMFADGEEGSAANVTDDVNANADSNIDDTATSDVSTNVQDDVQDSEQETKSKKDRTKEYSERLNKEREKMRKELEDEQNKRLDNIAKARGFENWKDLEEASNKEMLEDLGVNDTDAFNKYLNSVIANNPEMLRAKEIIARQEQEENQRKLNDDINEINKLDPSIKTVADLLQHPSYDLILDKVQKGASVLDAYKLVNFDALTNRSTDAAVQHTLNNINNKSHMKTVSGSATDDVVVPDDIYASYRKNLPNWTDEQIKKHYKREMDK